MGNALSVAKTNTQPFASSELCFKTRDKEKLTQNKPKINVSRYILKEGLKHSLQKETFYVSKQIIYKTIKQ